MFTRNLSLYQLTVSFDQITSNQRVHVSTDTREMPGGHYADKKSLYSLMYFAASHHTWSLHQSPEAGSQTATADSPSLCPVAAKELRDTVYLFFALKTAIGLS